MNNTSKSILLLSLSAAAAFGFADSTTLAAQTEKIEPRIAKPGTVLTITGRSLDKAHVSEVFLTDHRFDMKVKVIEQAGDHMLIRIPPFAKPGRLELLLLTAGAAPVYLEQPLYIQVVGSDEELPAPIEVSHHKKPKPTVEVASTGSSVPVPVNGAPPSSPAVSAELEKSVVPLQPKKIVETASVTPPVPAPATHKAAATPPPPVEVATAVTPQMTQVQARPVEIPVAPQQQPQHPQQQETAAPQPQTAIPPKPSPAVATTTKLPANDESASIPAKVMQKTSVRFPPAAAAQHIEGTVELITVVKADGHVKDVKVLKGNPFLVQAAISSVREWVYEPAYLHGKPIESEVTIVLNFKHPE